MISWWYLGIMTESGLAHVPVLLSAFILHFLRAHKAWWMIQPHNGFLLSKPCHQSCVWDEMRRRLRVSFQRHHSFQWLLQQNLRARMPTTKLLDLFLLNSRITRLSDVVVCSPYFPRWNAQGFDLCIVFHGIIIVWPCGFKMQANWKLVTCSGLKKSCTSAM